MDRDYIAEIQWNDGAQEYELVLRHGRYIIKRDFSDIIPNKYVLPFESGQLLRRLGFELVPHPGMKHGLPGEKV